MEKKDTPKIKPKRRRKKTAISELPFKIRDLDGLIRLGQQGHSYRHINCTMLWNILPQLIQLNQMVGMESLKQTIFSQIIYYLQNFHLDDTSNYLHTVITGDPGTGKCLAFNTPILMYNGTITPVQSIQVGDELMGDDNQPRRVISLSTGMDTMYRVYHGCDMYDVNAAHVLTLLNQSTQTVDDISVEAFLQLPIYKQQQYVGLKHSVRFPYTPLPVDGYLLGYTATHTRFVHDQPMIMIQDDTILARFQEIPELIQTTSTIANHYVMNMDYFQDIEGFSQTLTIPHALICNTPDIVCDILTGMMDGTSQDAEFEHVMHFDHTTYPLFCQLTFMCNILGIRFQWTDSTLYYQTIDTHAVHHYVVRFPDIQTQLDTCRHAESRPLVLTSPILIQMLGEGTYYGFELDGNGRFLLGNCIVTHNTTIAHIIGEMYKNMGILSTGGVFKIAKREDFVAEYLGQTAIKTKKLLDSCVGGVLFIDEVYALGPGEHDRDSFSKEAIDTITAFLSENHQTFCCIIAGYEDDVKRCFFSVNQGLARRFQWKHHIQSYTTQDLIDIFRKLLKEQIYWKTQLSDTFLQNVIETHTSLFQYYGGDVENLIAKSKIAHACRVLHDITAEKYLITEDDIHEAIEMMKPPIVDTDIDHHVFSMYI